MATINIPAGGTVVPSQTAGSNMNQGFVSTLEILKPENRPDFIKRFGDQRICALKDLITELGYEEATGRDEFGHWEDVRLHQGFEATVAGATVGAYATATFTVDAAFAKSGRIPVRVSDVVKFADGQMASVLSVNHTNGTFTAKPLEVWAFSDATNGGVKIPSIIVYREVAEGSDMPAESLRPETWRYENSVMIMNDKFEMTGTTATDRVWFNVVDADGKVVGSHYGLKGESDTAIRFENYQEGVLFSGKNPSKASGSLGAVEGLKGTSGLENDLKSYAINVDLGGQAITGSNIDNLIKFMNRNKAARENCWYAGIDQRFNLDDFLASQNAAHIGGTDFGTFANNQDAFMYLGFSGFERGGYKFALKTYEPFNEAEMLGFEGFNYTKSAFIIPMDKGRDPKTGVQVPSIGMRYKALDGYNRKIEVFPLGGADGVYTNGVDSKSINYRTHIGFESFAQNRMVWIEG
jgi:hypothetical protein